MNISLCFCFGFHTASPHTQICKLFPGSSKGHILVQEVVPVDLPLLPLSAARLLVEDGEVELAARAPGLAERGRVAGQVPGVGGPRRGQAGGGGGR
jgi:hypothetical protein